MWWPLIVSKCFKKVSALVVAAMATAKSNGSPAWCHGFAKGHRIGSQIPCGTQEQRAMSMPAWRPKEGTWKLSGLVLGCEHSALGNGIAYWWWWWMLFIGWSARVQTRPHLRSTYLRQIKSRYGYTQKKYRSYQHVEMIPSELSLFLNVNTKSCSDRSHCF